RRTGGGPEITRSPPRPASVTIWPIPPPRAVLLCFAPHERLPQSSRVEEGNSRHGTHTEETPARGGDPHGGHHRRRALGPHTARTRGTRGGARARRRSARRRQRQLHRDA